MQPTDGLIEGGALESDRRRLEQLVHEHGTSLLAYLLRRSENSEDAGDAFAEVMLVAWRRLDDVPPGDQARLWLFGVARRTLANARRSADRRLRLGERLRHDLASAPPPQPADVDASELVRSALRRLPDQHREVLLLSAWEGLEPTEIAAVIGVVPATARTRLRRARNRLRRELEASDGTNETWTTEIPAMRRAREERP